MFDATQSWIRNLTSLTATKTTQEAELAEAKAALVAAKVEAQRAINTLRVEQETAVANLKRELESLRTQITAETAHVASMIDWLTVAKRDANNVIASKPQRPA